MSENLKLRAERASLDDKSGRLSESPATDEHGPIDEAESQMRKALGLLGEAPRHRPEAERAELPVRSGGFSGSLHRRRFVQDGDVPVTVLRRDPGHEVLPHRSTAPSAQPTTSRLQRIEAALAAETASREKAERQLAETHSIVRDLQTKIGHAELAKVEALDALRREREEAIQHHAERDALEARVQELTELLEAAEKSVEEYQEQLEADRQARKQVEKALKVAEAAQHEAEQLVRALSAEAASVAEAPAARPADPPRRARPPAPDVVAPTRRRVAIEPAAEPEPVKWWLTTKATTKRR